MKKIQAYLAIIDPRLLHQIKGKSAEFIQAFKKYKPDSEEEFMKRFCGDNYSKDQYHKLKSNTIQELQSILLTNPTKGGSPLQKKFDFCSKKFLVGQKLLNNGYRNEGIRVIKQAHTEAVEYNFVHIACETSSHLAHHALYKENNPEKAALYAAQTDKYVNDYTAEKESRYLFHQIYTQSKKHLRPEDLKKALTKVQQLKGTSLRCIFYEYRLRILYGLHTNDYAMVTQECEKALIYFKDKKGVYSSSFLFFYLTAGITYIAQSRYEDAEERLTQAMTWAPKNSRNDLILQFYRTLTALHAGQYDRAYDYFLQYKNCSDSKIQQQFTIIEAYLYFLLSKGYTETDKPLRISKNLNKLLRIPLDKNHQDTSILIAQLLFFLTRDRNKFIPHVALAKAFSTQQMADKGFERVKIFIKILSLLPKANFHGLALQQLAKSHIQKLQNHPVQLGNDMALEIIPFEVIVEMILKTA